MARATETAIPMDRARPMAFLLTAPPVTDSTWTHSTCTAGSASTMNQPRRAPRGMRDQL